jgi:uncharacterized damage-inducible protein DinB
VKKSLEDYRKGAIGSLLDEYERAAFELKAILENVSEDYYTCIADAETQDEDCRSIETIMNHVIRAGYGYAKYMRDALSMESSPVEARRIPHAKIGEEIEKVIAHTAAIFEGERQITDEEMNEIFFKTRWGVMFNIDQLFEHAIVHVLRHRRQIEKFLLKFQTENRSSI